MLAVKPLYNDEYQDIQTYGPSASGNIWRLETCEHPPDIVNGIIYRVCPENHPTQGHKEESAPYCPLQLHIRYEALGFGMRRFIFVALFTLYDTRQA